MEYEKIISLKGIDKSFGGVHAVKDVSIDIKKGQIHGLVGANGAGKSTLIKTLAGVHQPDKGEIYYKGEPIEINNPHEARDYNLSFIHQELNLIQDFTVLENMTLGLAKESTLGIIKWDEMKNRAKEITNLIGLDISLNTPLKKLSPAEQWMVSIGRALMQNSQMIAMDEPTASLSKAEIETLFKVIEDLKKEGIAIIYVSHRLDEIMEICDEVTVMRNGEKILNERKSELSKEILVNKIGGLKTSKISSGKKSKKEDKNSILKVKNISDENKVKDASFELKEGEILGLAGLVGAGRTELAKIIYGAENFKSGQMEYKGKKYNPSSPREAVKKSIVFVPENRQEEGLVLNKNLTFNITLPILKQLKMSKLFPFLNYTKARNIAKELIEIFSIKTENEKSPILSLSGGNQQKVVISKWFERSPEIFIMDEPSRGVDVSARSEIHNIIKEMTNEGTSFLVISSTFEELPGLCDRVIVMTEGVIAGELVGDDINQDSILKMSYSHTL